MPTKILFLGSQKKSFHCLQYLLRSVNDAQIVAVVPNRAATAIVPQQDVRLLSEDHGVPVCMHEDIPSLTYDLGISVLYDRVLTPDIIEVPAKGFVNLHMGPLPRLRGVNSVMHALRLARRDNCWRFGVTMHYIDQGVDTGPIIDMLDMPIFEDDTAYDLHMRSSDKLFELFAKNIQRLVDAPARVEAKEQGSEAVSHLFRRKDTQAEVDLAGEPDAIYDQVRAFDYPGKGRAFARIGNRKIYLTIKPSE